MRAEGRERKVEGGMGRADGGGRKSKGGRGRAEGRARRILTWREIVCSLIQVYRFKPELGVG